MKIVCITYARTNDILSPEAWFRRLGIFIGAWEIIANTHSVTRLELLKFSKSERHNGIDYRFIDCKKNRVLFPWKLHRRVKHLKPDIVLVAGLHYPFQVLQLRLQIPSRVKIIAQHHAEKPFTGIKKWLQRLADKYISVYFFASIHSASPWIKQRIIGSVKKVRQIMEVSSLFDGIPPNEKAIDTSKAGHPAFLFVGRLIPNKDPLIVVRAFIRLLRDYPTARLIIIFQSAELLPQIESLIADHKGKVELVGEIPHEEMGDWYRKAAYIISGSQYEGSGTAICEAMSLGCIPILPNIDSFRGMTNEGSCGFLYQAGDEDSLMEALKKVMGSDAQIERKKTMEQFRRELSFDAIANKIQAVLESLKSFNNESA
jgi:glycosyltransferase involved in cell wall biosynthesis